MSSTSTRVADPVLGALRGELLDQVGDPAHAGVDLGLVELAGQADRLGALLVGVAEHPDRVEAALGEEALELGDVVLGLPREAEDDVGAEPGRRGPGDRARSISARKSSVPPNRRIRRSSVGDECWKDRSK